MAFANRFGGTAGAQGMIGTSAGAFHSPMMQSPMNLSTVPPSSWIALVASVRNSVRNGATSAPYSSVSWVKPGKVRKDDGDLAQFAAGLRIDALLNQCTDNVGGHIKPEGLETSRHAPEGAPRDCRSRSGRMGCGAIRRAKSSRYGAIRRRSSGSGARRRDWRKARDGRREAAQGRRPPQAAIGYCGRFRR